MQYTKQRLNNSLSIKFAQQAIFSVFALKYLE
jgi:hypothetical protein